ncbi:HNH endonuclease [Salmonella enterica subsp. enterica]|nr:HNH endonuclease [Salmonella enterica subsp. enterica serovar Bareilly]
MNLARLYSQLIGICEERNGKPKSKYARKSGYEIHHIIAQNMGGSDHPNNLVLLTPKEHYLAHHILARLYGGGLSFAFWRMTNGKKGRTGLNQPATARQYATAKALISRQMTGIGHPTGPRRKPRSEAHKAALSAACKGKRKRHGRGMTEAHKEAIRQALLGKKHSPERIANMKAAKLAKKHTLNGE